MSVEALSDHDLIDSMVEVANAAENKWPRQFAHSMIRKANCTGWRPSVKQRAMMRRLVGQLDAHVDCSDVIDHDDDFTRRCSITRKASSRSPSRTDAHEQARALWGVRCCGRFQRGKPDDGGTARDTGTMGRIHTRTAVRKTEAGMPGVDTPPKVAVDRYAAITVTDA